MLNIHLKSAVNERIEKDNYGNGLVKNWTIRKTVHVFDQEDLPIFKCQDEGNPYLSHNWDLENLFIDWIRNECRMSPDRLNILHDLL